MEIYKNAQLIGKAIGNLESLKTYADLPPYQKEWLKDALNAIKLVDYINLQNKF
jgi:hypothetical protein|tara:strand:+ start:3543 stop:3704 length:162 start_codon:yes stop_codon:yes gene_type:complete